jgi:type I restriction-modification system DNA methylase subunit
VNYSEIVSFIWGVADLIRDTFKRGKYQDVILPLTVLRRLDCVLAPTKDKVIRSGPGTVRLGEAETAKYIKTRFPGAG